MKRFYTETSPCIRRDCSVRSFCCCVVCRVTIGFEQKLSKKVYFNSLCTITRQPSHFWILPSAKLAVQVAGNIIIGRGLKIIFVCILLLKPHIHLIHASFWVLLHLMFMFDWKQQPASDKPRDLENNQDKKFKSMTHFKGQQFLFTKTCVESEVSLKILSNEKILANLSLIFKEA